MFDNLESGFSFRREAEQKEKTGRHLVADLIGPTPQPGALINRLEPTYIGGESGIVNPPTVIPLMDGRELYIAKYQKVPDNAYKPGDAKSLGIAVTEKGRVPQSRSDYSQLLVLGNEFNQL